MWLTHVLPHRLTSKPRFAAREERLHMHWVPPTFYHNCVVLLVDPPVESGEGVRDGDDDDGGQQAEPWRPHAGGLVGCARKTGWPECGCRFRAGHRAPNSRRTRGFSSQHPRHWTPQLRPADGTLIFIGPRCPWGPIYGSGSL